MAKQKYLTEYPAILKEKAKNAGVKIKKADSGYFICSMLAYVYMASHIHLYGRL